MECHSVAQCYHTCAICTATTSTKSVAERQGFCRCFVTKSLYTEEEDFRKADAVYDCIGDKGHERFSYSDMVKHSLQESSL